MARRAGHCGTTTRGTDCSHADSGSWPLSASINGNWDLAFAGCQQQCSQCSRCRHISVSLFYSDCSWFHACPELKRSPPGFRTLLDTEAAVTSDPACSRAIHLTHIPKTASTSLGQELRASNCSRRGERFTVTSLTPGGWDGGGDESCLAANARASALNVVLLRAPREHVVSMFYMCRDSTWGRLVTNRSSFQERFGGRSNANGLRAWVRHFVALGGSRGDDFGCYDLRDMQTRQLVCTRREAGAPHRWLPLRLPPLRGAC